MSILIRGMEMPTSCGFCPFKCWTTQGDECMYGVADMTYQGRPKDCPLFHVPPHGRLIDADVLIKEMDKQENAMYEHGREFSFSFKSGGDVCTAWYNVEMMVEDAPTIIPASDKEARK